MKRIIASAMFVMATCSAMAAYTYSYENDNKTLVVTVDSGTSWLQADEVQEALNANTVTNLVKRGTGTFGVNGTATDFTGDVRIESGVLQLRGTNPLGTSGTIMVPSAKTLDLNQANVAKDIVLDGRDWSKNTRITVWTGSSSVSGKVILGTASNAYAGNTYFTAYKEGVVTFSGGVEDYDSNHGQYLYCRPNTGGKYVFSGKPVMIKKPFYIQPNTSDQPLDSRGFAGYFEFAAEDNSMSSLGYDNGSTDSRMNYVEVKTTVDWAFNNASMRVYVGHDSVWDLCGTSQRVGYLDVKHASGNATVITNSLAAPATLYVTQTANSTPDVRFGGNLSVNLSGNYTTTIAYPMTATGGITVNAGTLAFAAGGSWANAASVTVADGAHLSIASDDAFSAGCDLVLGGDNCLEIAAGVEFGVKSVTVGGSPVDGGVLYTRDNAAWLSGDGAVFVPRRPVAGTEVRWTGEGEDTLMTIPGNWDGAVDLVDGTSIAVFADGGATATVSGDILLNGLSFTTSGAFKVVPENAAALLRIASGGIDVSGSGTYSITAPICVDGSQTWNVGKAVEFSGGIYANPLSRYAVAKTGSAQLKVSGGGDFAGDVEIADGSIVLSGENALGGAGTITVGNGKVLVFSAATTAKDVVLMCGGTTKLSVWKGDSELSGRVAMAPTDSSQAYGDATFVAYDTGKLTFRGGLEDVDSSHGGQPYFVPNGGSTFEFADKPVKMAKPFLVNPDTAHYPVPATGYAGYFVFSAPSNTMQAFGSSSYRFNYCSLKTTVDWAFDKYNLTMHIGHDSVWDLCGTSQRVGQLAVNHSSGAASVITNSLEMPATLNLGMIYASPSGAPPDIRFGGKLSVSFANLYATQINHAMTAEGSITVDGSSSSHSLAFTENGSWRNATDVIVKNAAKVTVANPRAFGRDTNIILASPSSLEIASGVTVRVLSLTIGGVERPAGTYQFGEGWLNVGGRGLQIIFR